MVRGCRNRFALLCSVIFVLAFIVGCSDSEVPESLSEATSSSDQISDSSKESGESSEAATISPSSSEHNDVTLDATPEGPEIAAEEEPPDDPINSLPTRPEVEEQGPEMNNLLDQLELINRGAESTSPYSPDEFCGWQDLDGDGLTTREEILRREKVEGVGWWYSRWDGHWYEGEGELTAEFFDIDHIVSKKEAWQSGAHGWTYDQRCQFANDELNLTAVTYSSNRSKGARDAAEWLPSEPSGTCFLMIRVIQVKKLWDLTVDETEYSQLRDLAIGCEHNIPEIPFPPREPTWPLDKTEEESTEQSSTPPIPVDQTNNQSSNQFYQTANGIDIDLYDANANGDINCGELPSAARPVIVISPGSDPYRLDGDNDGIGCEG